MTNSPYPDPQNAHVTAAGDQPAAAGPSALQRSVDLLVNGLIGAYDLSANAAVQTYIAQVLARVGVERTEAAPGAAFDPSVHEAVSTVTTEDSACYRRVAQTLRPGWRRLGAVLRAPQVSVWVADPSRPGAATGSDANGGH